MYRGDDFYNLLLADLDGYDLQSQSAAGDDFIMEIPPSAATAGGSSSGGGGNDNIKKTRYHRHTHLQIKELEAFFKVCPHPDDNERKELGYWRSMEPFKIKFWFQNKRTQAKAQNERNENF